MKISKLNYMKNNRYQIPRSTISVCPHCGEVFPKVESLELHQAVRHAGQYFISATINFFYSWLFMIFCYYFISVFLF